MPIPANSPLRFGTCNKERWEINGRHYTIGSFAGMVKDRNLKTTNHTMLRRLRAGERDLEKILAEPDKCRSAEHKARRAKARAEMREILDQMGPPRRY